MFMKIIAFLTSHIFQRMIKAIDDQSARGSVAGVDDVDVVEAVGVRLDGKYVPNLLGEGAQEEEVPTARASGRVDDCFLVQVVARV
jgi:hypothetical protein